MDNNYNSLKQHLQKLGFDIDIEFYKELKDMVNHFYTKLLYWEIFCPLLYR